MLLTNQYGNVVKDVFSETKIEELKERGWTELVEEKDEQKPIDLSKLNKDKLIEYATSKGIDLEELAIKYNVTVDKVTKEKIIKAIEESK